MPCPCLVGKKRRTTLSITGDESAVLAGARGGAVSLVGRKGERVFRKRQKEIVRSKGRKKGY